MSLGDFAENVAEDDRPPVNKVDGNDFHRSQGGWCVSSNCIGSDALNFRVSSTPLLLSFFSASVSTSKPSEYFCQLLPIFTSCSSFCDLFYIFFNSAFRREIISRRSFALLCNL